MRKLERRSVICLILAAFLIIGTGLFTYRFAVKGAEWATFYGNGNVYDSGLLKSGKIVDRNGVFLAESGDGTITYSDDWETRIATVHAVGDVGGNISTGALAAFKAKMIGYNPVTGTYKLKGKNSDLSLTIDSDACRVAYEWLSEYKSGAVGVYNYKTGDILCMVSTPGFDPANPPETSEEDESGVYINRFMSSTMVPGSVFKLVTSAAVIDKVPAYMNFEYSCSGTRIVDGEEINCMHVHGDVDFYGALSGSCNCAYSVLSEMVGIEVLEEYTKKAGLTKVYDIDGINNVPGTFEFPRDSQLDADWVGIGQFRDQVNPCSMMIFMGAIANDGKAAIPHLAKSINIKREETGRLLDIETTQVLREMMKWNVKDEYGEGNFPGLDIYAKSGTAEGESYQPDAWFVGFTDSEESPYAFVVWVKGGGYGAQAAAPIANRVLQTLGSGGE